MIMLFFLLVIFVIYFTIDHAVFLLGDLCRLFPNCSMPMFVSPWRSFSFLSQLLNAHVCFSLVIFVVSFPIAQCSCLFLLGDLCLLFHDWPWYLSHGWSLSFSLRTVFSICLSVIRIDLISFWLSEKSNYPTRSDQREWTIYRISLKISYVKSFLWINTPCAK